MEKKWQEKPKRTEWKGSEGRLVNAGRDSKDKIF